MAAQLVSLLPRLKRGSLSVYGDVFGGRVDNVHTVVAARAVDARLVIEFDGGEVLQVWAPEGLVASASQLVVQRAERVRWEWYHYDREHVGANLRFIEHVRVGEVVEASSGPEPVARALSPSARRPAVELL